MMSARSLFIISVVKPGTGLCCQTPPSSSSRLPRPVIAAPSLPDDHCEMKVTRGLACARATPGRPAIAAAPAVPARNLRRRTSICSSLGTVLLPDILGQSGRRASRFRCRAGEAKVRGGALQFTREDTDPPRMQLGLSWSSGPRASRSLMRMSERDARGPEDHEHLFLVMALMSVSATGVARSDERQRRSAQNSWMRLQPSRRLSRSVA